MRWPSSVSWACGRSRRNRSPPSSPSSCLMARVSDGCVTLHVSAALVKLRSLTVARKYLTWCIFLEGFYQAVSQLALGLVCPGAANGCEIVGGTGQAGHE